MINVVYCILHRTSLLFVAIRTTCRAPFPACSTKRQHGSKSRTWFGFSRRRIWLGFLNRSSRSSPYFWLGLLPYAKNLSADRRAGGLRFVWENRNSAPKNTNRTCVSITISDKDAHGNTEALSQASGPLRNGISLGKCTLSACGPGGRWLGTIQLPLA